MEKREKERAQSLWKVFGLWHTKEAGLEAMADSMGKHYGHPFDMDELEKLVLG